MGLTQYSWERKAGGQSGKALKSVAPASASCRPAKWGGAHWLFSTVAQPCSPSTLSEAEVFEARLGQTQN